VNRAEQQRVYLQSLIDAARNQGAAVSSYLFPAAPGTARALSPFENAQAELARLETAKSALLAKGYTSQHPDMAKIQREIAKAQDTVARLRASAPRPTEEGAALTGTVARVPDRPAADGDRAAIAQLRSQLESNRLEIENLTKEEQRLKVSISKYEARLNQTPVREQEQAGIVRDTEALRLEYADLLKKEQESQLATNLEKQQGGQQFRLIDPASLPSVPSSPKRLKMSLGGLAGGLGLGIALAFLMEMKDTSFYTEKELTKYLGPPFVLGVPVLLTTPEKHRRLQRNILQWIAASVIVLAVVASELYVYKRS
jgi:DNA polymerase III alpha subunit